MTRFFFNIDVLGSCNLRCPSCPVGNSRDVRLPTGFMEPPLLAAIIAKAKAESVAARAKLPGADFARLAAKFNQAGGWTDGDSNYDGQVGIGDFSLLASNFNRTLPGDLPRALAPVAGTIPVSRAPAFGSARISDSEILDLSSRDLF